MMNTPAIMNPANVAATGKQAATPPDSAAPDVPFNQVLSREMANRGETAKSGDSSASATASGTSSAPAKAAGKGSEKESVKGGGDKKAADTAVESEAAAPGIPADLLALVANIGQLAAMEQASTATTTDDAGMTSTAEIVGSDSNLGAGIPVDAKALLASASNTASDAGDKRTPADIKDIGELGEFKNIGTRDREPAALTLAETQPAQNAAVAAEADASATFAAQLEAAELSALAPTQTTAALTALQQTAHAALHAAPGHAADRLTPQVGTPAWDQALGQRIVWMVAGTEQSASLTLNPPDLGPLQVVLNVSNTTANATFVAAQPEVRQALEAAMPKLREMLGDAGIQLGQANVSSGMQDRNGSPAEPTQRRAGAGDAGIDNGDTQIHASRGRTVSSGQGLVDTFV
ncbi:MAG TPA: flagellar hook-length control protein FliK [Paucimonas sp.]|nr:flagellar hook-length control protein FliK [Paucimonas sp.]